MENKKEKLFQASTILFILNVLASALNYLCQLVLARVLSVESYGTINIIFSFMMIVAVPGTTLTMVVAKYFAEDNAKKSLYLRRQIRVVLFLTMIVFVILLVGQSVFEKILSISDEVILLLTFTLAALGYFQPLYSGVFSGSKLFVLVGLYSLCIPLYKLMAVGGAYVYSVDDKVRLYVVLIIMVLGALATALYGHIKSKRILKAEKNNFFETKDKLYSLEDVNTLILNISLMLYMNIDLLAVRYYGSETDSGLYSSVLLFGRIIYYFATTLGTVLLPSVASESDQNHRMGILNKVLILMIGFGLLCMIPINMFKEFFIRLLYGVDYLPAAKYVIYVSVISLALSIYTIMVNYVVGIGRTKVATIIMIIVDIVLVSAVLVMYKINRILLVIGMIGVVGAMVIYFNCLRTQSRK